MAIAIRGGSHSVGASNSNPVTVTLTGTKQPQAGDVLLIFYSNDYFAFSEMDVIPSVGGSETGVNAISGGSADVGNLEPHARSYTYVVGSTGDLTVSATETGAAGTEEKFLYVYVLSGVNTTTPTDGAVGALSATTTTPHTLTALSPTTSDAMLFAHLMGGGGTTGPNAGSYTPPGGGWTEAYDESPLGFTTATGGYQQLSASGSTGTRSFTPAASSTFAGIMVAMRTASAGGGGGPVAAPMFFRPTQAGQLWR